MNMLSLVHSKKTVFAAGLLVGLTIILIFQTTNRLNTFAKTEPVESNLNKETMLEVHYSDMESIGEIAISLHNLQQQLSSELAEIKSISQQNRQEISELWLFQDRQDYDQTTESNGDEVYKQDPDQQQAEAAIEAEIQQASYLRQLDDFIASQPEDISWSSQVESDFASAFENHMDLIQMGSVSCGDMMCKVSADVIGVERGAAQQLPPLDHIIHGDVQWQGQSFYKMDLDTGEITLYLMREGIDFPVAREG